MGSRYGRMVGRRGAKRALVAIGHEILKIVYHILQDGTCYKELGANYCDARRKKAMLKHHLNALSELGVDLPEELVNCKIAS